MRLCGNFSHLLLLGLVWSCFVLCLLFNFTSSALTEGTACLGLYKFLHTRLKQTVRIKHKKTQDFTWNILRQLHMLPKSSDSLAQSTIAAKVIRQAVLLLKSSTFRGPTASCCHARGKSLHMALRKVIYS